MPKIALAVLAVALVVAVYRLPLRAAFGLVLATLFLVPGIAIVPGFGDDARIGRVALIAFLISCVRRRSSGELQPGAFHPTPLHAAFLVYAAVSLVNGLVLADEAVVLGDALRRFALLGDQFLVLCATIAVYRSTKDQTLFVGLISGLALLSAGIGILEHVSGHAYGHWLLSHTSQAALPAASGLDTRLGELRSRAGFEYPLQYAWVLAACVPYLFVFGLELRKRRALATSAMLLVVLLAVYWSFSRSQVAGLVVAALIVAAATARGRITAGVGVATAIVLGLLVLVPQVGHRFSTNIDQGSIDVRKTRLQDVFDIALQHQYHGRGLTGLVDLGFPSLDATYLLSYAEIGVVGVTLLVVLLSAALIGPARGLRASRRVEDVLAPASLAAVAVLVMAGFAFDSLALYQSSILLWVFAGLGVAAAEELTGPWRLVVPSLPRLAAVGAALALACLAVALAPVRHSEVVVFNTIRVSDEARLAYDPTGTAFPGSVCALARDAARDAGVKVRCRTDVQPTAGAGDIRMEGRTAAAVTAALRDTQLRVLHAGLASYRQYVQSVESGRASLVRTSVVWLPGFVLGLVLLLPRIEAPRFRD